MNNPVLTGVNYNAATGILIFSGANLSNGIQQSKFNLQVNGNNIALSSADTVGTISSSGFTVTLSSVHKTALNNLFTMNGLTDLAHHAYTLNATAGWDNNTGVAISSQAVSVTGYQTITLGHLTTQANLTDTSSLHPFSSATLSDSNTLAIDTATISFTAANGSLSGAGLSAAVLNNGVATYTVSATSATSLQQILQSLVFTPTAHQGTAGSTINTVLTLTVADQIANTVLSTLGNNSTQVTVTESALPTVNTVSYNASNGQLTVSGNVLTSGVLLNDLTLSTGKQSLTLNANDNISNLTTNGFTVTLNSSEQNVVNAFFNSNGTGSTPYTLTASNGWDHGYGAATSQTVTVSGAGPITLDGFTAQANLLDTATIKPFSTVTVTDTQTNVINETAIISYTATNGTLSGTGLSAESINNGIATYTLTAGSAASLQQALQSLTFTPTAHQGASGQTYSTALTLTVTNQVLNYQDQPALTVQGIYNPTSLVFDSLGHLWESNYGVWDNNSDRYLNGNVKEFSNSGVLMQTLSSGINLPSSLKLDNQGHVWIANANTIEEFSNSGVLMQTLSNGIINPSSLVFDSQGNLWVANNSTVEEFSISGVLVQTLSSGVNNPSSLLFDSQGHLWIANDSYSNSNVEEFSTSGVLMQTMSNAISFPQSLVFDSQAHLWVMNSGNNTIEEFSVSGVLLQTLSNGISNPTSLVLDNQGHLWVANNSYATSTVEEFSTSGVLMQTMSNGIDTPSSLAFDSQGYLWIANDSNSNSNVEEFSTSGVLKQSLSSSINQPDNLVLDSQGHLWVANNSYATSTIEEFSTSGVLMQTLSNGINQPTTLVFDTQGHLWVTNDSYSNSTIEEFSTSGVLMQALSNGINQPTSLVFDKQGHLWVANDRYSNSTIEEFSTSGILMQTLSNGISYANTLLFDNQGNLWVANSGNNTIAEFSVSGVLMQTLSNGIIQPESLLFDSQWHLWVANQYGNTVEEFSTSGTLIQTLSTGINGPCCMAFDTQGHLWVANQNGNTIEEFSVSGLLMQTLSNGINSPTSVVFDSQGNLWVGNQASLEEFSANMLSKSVTYQSAQITVTETTQHLTINPNSSIANPTVFNTVHSGDILNFADATSFNTNAVTAANVTAAGGAVTTLAGWVTGALNAKGANEASHNIDWFNFNGNTYLVEQANTQGSAYSSGDSLVQLVGVFNESHASFSGHTLTLA